jgi:predicted RNA binding protein YcfA (HicA-like mRNA interferase family)
MSSAGDIRKALRDHGFKLASANKHLVYRNPQGHEVRLHKGNKISQRKFTAVLKDIQRGNSVTGRFQQEGTANAQET